MVDRKSAHIFIVKAYSRLLINKCYYKFVSGKKYWHVPVGCRLVISTSRPSSVQSSAIADGCASCGNRGVVRACPQWNRSGQDEEKIQGEDSMCTCLN
jgi:hypothetical protein